MVLGRILTDGVVPSSIVPYYFYNEFCRNVHFTRAKHFLTHYMVEHTCIL